MSNVSDNGHRLREVRIKCTAKKCQEKPREIFQTYCRCGSPGGRRITIPFREPVNPARFLADKGR